MFVRNKILWFSVLASLLVHLVLLFWIRQWWQGEVENDVFRARLAIPPKFEPKRLGAAEPLQLPPRQMEYLATEAEARKLQEMGLDVHALPPSEIVIERADQVLEEVVAIGAKSSIPILAREEMVSPTEMAFIDTMGSDAMELLRLIDMARANREHGMVVPDLSSMRDLMGYLNVTRLRVYGAGSDTAGAVDALARYIRDYTGLLVQMHPMQYDYFLSDHLLKDPIHFLFEGGGLTAHNPDRLTDFSEEEKELIGRYLRQGGFLFIEGRNRFLREMIAHLEYILGGDGKIYELPPSHPIYYSYYSYPSGFPGEVKGNLLDVEGSAWYYPDYQARDAAELALLNEDVNPFQLAQPQDSIPPPLGVWGIELDGELVAVLSDLRMYTQWAGGINPATEERIDTGPTLQAATNIIVYALTRSSGLTSKRARPAWMQTRPDVPVSFVEPEDRQSVPVDFVDDSDLLDELDATLALVRAPLGDPIGRGGMEVVVDGGYSLELLQRQKNGLLLRNMPAGLHWIEVRYQGESKQVEVDLAGGKVTTLVFGINRIAFILQLRLSIQEEQIGLLQWLSSFTDLEIQEIFLSDEEKVLLGLEDDL